MNKKLSFLSLFLVLALAFSSLASTNWSFDNASKDVTVSSLGLTSSLSTTISSTDNNSVTVSSLALSSCGETDLDSSLVATTPFNLTANTSAQTINFQLNVTNAVSSGDYACTLTATDSDGDSDTLTLNVNISEIDDFSIGDTGLPSSMDVGNSHNGSFTITNDGNVAQSFNVTFSEKNGDDYEEDLTLALTDSNGNTLASGFNTGSLSVGQSYTINYNLSSTKDLTIFHGENMGYAFTVVNGNGDTKTKDLATQFNSDAFDISLELDPDDELEPGEEFTVEVTVENDAGVDMEDVEIKIWIQDIDDNQDLEAETSKFSLGDDDDKTKKFDFQVPYNVDAGDYNVLVRVEGEDEDNSSNDFKVYELFRNSEGVTVEKQEDEDVVFINFETSTSSLTCGDVFTSYVDLVNVGTDDLDDMYVKLTIEDLNLEYTSETFDLDSSDEDDRVKELQFLVSLPLNLTETSYSVKFHAYNENDEVFDASYETLPVESCASSTSDTEEDTADETTTDETTEDSGVVYYPTGFSIADWFTTENAKLSFWIIGDVVLLLIAVYFISLLFRKRR